MSRIVFSSPNLTLDNLGELAYNIIMNWENSMYKKLKEIWQQLNYTDDENRYQAKIKVGTLVGDYDNWAECLADELAGELGCEDSKDFIKDIILRAE